MISKLVTPPAVRSAASPSRSTAACTDGIAAHAVSTERGRGTRRSTAAVMMPSVPSAPMNRFLQVVAGVVLLELVQVVEDAAVGQHHFKPERVRARHAVCERRGAAGVGREVAADGAGAFRRQQLRIEPVGVGGGFARALQGDAGLAGDGVGNRIDLADLVHAVEREHHLAVVRDLAPDQAGVAALGARSRSRSRWRSSGVPTLPGSSPAAAPPAYARSTGARNSTR